MAVDGEKSKPGLPEKLLLTDINDRWRKITPSMPEEPKKKIQISLA